MAKFKWRVNYYEGSASTRCDLSETVEADNASQAEEIVRSRMASYGRSEIRRVGTAGPLLSVYPMGSPALRRADTDKASRPAMNAIVPLAS